MAASLTARHAAPRGDAHPVLAWQAAICNARAEALNNKAKLIVRRAYGFHSARAAFALIHRTCGPITLTLPHEQTA